MAKYAQIRWTTAVAGLALALIASPVARAATVPMSLSLSGELANSSNQPITQSNVNFRLQVYDINDTCVLYQEDHLGQDLSQTDGRFALVLGAGTSITNNVSGALALDTTVFNNSGPTTVTGCTGGVNLSAGSARHLKVQYDLGGGMTAMTPNVPIVSSAYAMVSETLGGLNAGQFIQVASNGSTSLTQANTNYAFSATNWPRLKALLDGNSNQYLMSNGTAPIDMNGNRVIDVADPTAAQDAATKHYVDTNVAGAPVDVTGVGPATGGGKTLVWDQVADKWVAQTLSTTPTGTAGGSLTGTYPNPTIATGALTAAMVGTANAGISRMVMTDAVTGTNLVLGVCAINQVYAWTASGFACTNVSALSPVTSVAGSTGAVVLNAGMINGLGTAALYDWGTGAGQIPKLDGSGRMPAVDGSQLTNVNAVALQTLPVSAIAPTSGQVLGWNGSAWLPVTGAAGSVTSVATDATMTGGPITSTGTLGVNVGTGANQILQLNASAQIPAVDGSLLYNVTLGGRSVATTAPTANQVVGWNQTSSQWQPMSAAVGSVTNVSAGFGLLGGPITSTGTLSVNAGSAANQIVVENANAQIAQGAGSLALPSYTFYGNTNTGLYSPGANQLALVANGSAALNVAASGYVGVGTTAPAALFDVYGLGPQSGILIPRDTTGNRPTGINGMLRYNTTTGTFEGYQAGVWATISSGSSAGTVLNIATDSTLLGGPITTSGTLAVNVGSAAGKIVQENSNAQIAQLSGSVSLPSYSFVGNTNTGLFSPSANQVALATNGTTAMTVDAGGNVGVGAVPIARLDVNGAAHFSGATNNNYQGFNLNWNAETGSGGETDFINHHGGGALGGFSFFDTNSGVNGTELMVIRGSGLVGIGTVTPLAALDVTSVGTSSAIIVPRDTTGNRPTGVNGMLRYNTTLTAMEGYINGMWQTLSSGSSAGTVTNIQTDSTLLGGPITTAGTLSVNVGSSAGKIVQENSNAQIAQLTGSAALPSYTFVGNTNSGLFSPAANQVALSTNGTAALTVLANGSVGIGTTAPASLLANQSATLGDGAGTFENNQSLVWGANGSGYAVGFGNTGGTSISNGVTVNVSGSATTQRMLNLRSSLGDVFVVTAAGSVGIGSSSPLAALDVNTVGTTSAIIVPRDTTGNRPIGVNGMLRYNTTLTAMEGYINGMWQTLSSGSSAGTVTNIQTDSTLLGGPITTTGTLGVNVGTTANKILQLNASAQIPAVDGSLLTNVNAVSLQSRPLAATAPIDGQVIGWNQTVSSWQPMNVTNGTVISIASGTGLLGGPISTTGTLSVDVGSAAGKIVQENSNAQIAQSTGSASLPSYAFVGNSNTGVFSPGANQVALAANGTAALTVSAADYVGIGTGAPAATLDVYGLGPQSGILIPRDTTGNRPTGINGMLRYNTTTGFFEGYQSGTWATIASGSSAGTVLNIASGTGLLGGPITTTGTLSVNVGTGANQIVQENGSAQIAQNVGSVVAPSYAFTGNLTSGFYSPAANQLAFANNGTATMTLTQANLVGIGTATPGAALDIFALGAQSAILLPRDTTANRPTGVNGMFRYNSTSNTFEGYQGGTWATIASGSTAGTVLNVATDATMVGGPITTTGTLGVNVGSAAGKIVQENANAQIAQLTGSAALPSYSFSGNTNTGLFSPGANQLAFANNGTATLTLSAGNAVGIGTATPGALLDLYGLGAQSAILLPRDTTANRPTGVNGMFRYNSTSNAFEGYQGGVWATIASGSTAGTVINIATGTGLTGGPITTTGTLAVDVGSAAFKIVQENANAQIAQMTGSASLPSYAFAGNTNTGLFSPGANSVALSTNGTAALNVLASGNVGIGTAAPQGVLDLYALGTSSAMLVPRDTTTNRPTGVNGMLRYNTTLTAMEGYINGMWQTLSSGSSAGTVTNIQTDATLLGGPITTAGTLSVNVGSAAGKIVQENSNAQIAQLTGSASLPSYSFVGNTNTGVFSPGANQLAFANNGTATLTLSALNTVGIGTATPGAALDIYALGAQSAVLLPRDTTANRPTGVNGMFRYNSTSNTFEGYQGGVWATIASGSTAGTVINIATGTGLTGGPITTTGTLAVDVGSSAFKIVQENANAQITQVTGSAALPTYSFVGNTNTGVFSPGINQIALSANGTAALNVLATGNVGIGTAAPQGVLDLYALGTSSAMLVPRDTTVNRPTGVNGMLRYNTTLTAMEGYINGAWQTLSSGSSAGTVTNIQTDSTLLGGPITTAGTLSVNVGSAAGKIVQENANAQIAQLTGSAALPSYTFVGNTSTGLFSPAVNQVAFANNGTTTMTLTAANLVGIGTATPGAALDIYALGAQSAVLLPRDTTANRPTGVNGMFRYNSTSNTFEGYQGGSWATIASGSTAGTVINIATGTGLTGGPITTTGTLAVDAGSAAFKIVQENVNAQILQTAGSASLPSYAFVGNVSTGLFSPGANQIALSANGTAALSVVAAGNVGVGTSAPQGILDLYSIGTSSAMLVPRDVTANRPTGVNGMIRYNTTTAAFEGYQAGAWTNLIGSGSTSFPLLASPGTTAPGAPSYSFSGNANTGVFSPATNQVAVATNGTTALTVAANGYIGIGSTAPAKALDVVGTIQTSGSVWGANGSATSPTFTFSTLSNAGMYLSGMNTLGFSTAGLQRATIDGSGNFGINSATPQAGLDVAVVGTTSAILVPRDTTGNRPAGVNGMIRYNTTNSAFEAYQAGAWTNLIGAGSTSFPLIASPGTTTAAAPSYSFAGSTNTGLFSPGANQLALATAGTTAVTILANGNVGVGTTSPQYPIQTTVNWGASTTPSIAALNTNTAGKASIQAQNSSSGYAAMGVNGNAYSLPAFANVAGFTAGNVAKFMFISDEQAGTNGTAPMQFVTGGFNNTPTLTLTAGNPGSVGVGTIAPAAALDVNVVGSTSAVILPRDTTTNRPTGVNGMIRYNTTTAAFEGYQAGAWTNLISAGGGTSSSLIFNGLTAATGTSSIDNTNYAQIWNWSTATTQTPLSIKANALTSASALSVTTTSPSLSSTSGLLQVANLGTATGGIVARIQSNNTNAASGLTVLANGAVGINTTNPSVALNVVGGILTTQGSTFSNNNIAGSFQLVNGSSTNPGYAFFYSTDTGMFEAGQGSHAVAFSTSGAERLRINPAGLVAIGGTSPQAILDVNASGTTSAIIIPRDTTTNRPTGVNGMLRYNTTTAAFEGYQAGAWTNLIGAGSGSTSFPLIATPGTTSASAPSYSFQGSTNTGLYSPGASQLALSVAGTPALNIAANTRVGIGSSTPAAQLDISSSSTSMGLQVQAPGTTSNGVIYANATGTNTNGIVGEADNGNSWGVWGQTASTGGGASGVYGGNYSSTGSGTGVGGEANSPNARAAAFTNNAATGAGIGVYTSVASASGFALFSNSGLNYLNGRTGIYTQTPQAALDIAGTGTNSAMIVPRDTTANRPTAVNGMLRYNTTTAAFEGYQAGAWTNLIGGTGSTSFPLLASPGTTTAATPSYSFSGNSNTGFYSPGTNQLAFATNGTAALNIASSGFVGIGTSAPAFALQVAGNVGSFGDVQIQANNTNSGGTATVSAQSDQGGTSIVSYGSGDGFQSSIKANSFVAIPLTFQINNTERMRIDGATGNVGVGSTSPLAALDVAMTGTNSALIVPRDTTANRPSTNVTNGMIRYNTTTAAFEGYANGAWGSLGGGGSVSFPLLASPGTTPVSAPSYSFGGNTNTGFYSPATNSVALATNGTAALTILPSGWVGIGTTAPSQVLEVAGSVKATSFITTSDRRLKTDVETIKGLEAILKLRGVQFKWIKDGSPEVGLIAQEVEQVFPELVVTDPVTGLKAVKYQNLVSPLIEATKELEGRVRDLESENKKLRDDLDELRRDVQALKDKR